MWVRTVVRDTTSAAAMSEADQPCIIAFKTRRSVQVSVINAVHPVRRWTG